MVFFPREVSVQKLRIGILVASAVVGVALSSSAAAGGKVSKADWVEAMKSALPGALCPAGGYFLSCFKMTSQECQDVALTATKKCLASLDDKFPAEFHQPDDGRKWGTQVGTCTGEGMELALKGKKNDTAKCNDPGAWSN